VVPEWSITAVLKQTLTMPSTATLGKAPSLTAMGYSFPTASATVETTDIIFLDKKDMP
jgi:hypothetical protein